MLYNGKKVFTSDSFDYSVACPGDYVTQEVVDDAVDCLPPACMTSSCVQLGEPYSHRGGTRPRAAGGPPTPHSAVLPEAGTASGNTAATASRGRPQSGVAPNNEASPADDAGRRCGLPQPLRA